MAHPKRRQSSTRRDKRRTHDKLTPKAISICSNTGELHLRHKAYVVDGDLYLNGKVAIKDYAPVAAPVATDNDEE
ncbi:50S ribosomal protein L32 [Hymenobacter wooponensis]|uniref:Large ribosomal subunit protein bL32 n=1 Tax=Hymenobacter wooponensis TaxID=1525360 RepID=A0A4Z0MMT1_9BACT|nr:50S ribosomal protein L32 [Hymenobacter wooponensis]TGD80686.1 50S ribosomal protein L32 [Hymenobacter wooponensis]